MRPRFALGLVMIASCVVTNSGCTHIQLQKNTTCQAKTVSDIYEQQVLDNLAMFVCNPYSTPFFSAPSQGLNQVNDTGKFAIAATGFTGHFWKAVSADGTRGMNQSWTFIPIVAPDRLRLMQCAYQHAVGSPSDECDKCCDLEKDWFGKNGTRTLKVFNPETRELLLDPKTCEPFLDKISSQQFIDCPVSPVMPCRKPMPCPLPDGAVYLPINEENLLASEVGLLDEPTVQLFKPTILTDPRTGRPYEYNVKTGEVTIPKKECHDPCGITCGWVQYSDRWRDVPKCCCKKYGFHCGTYVWVDPCYEHEFSKLVLTIVEYASGDKAIVPSDSTKQVTFYLNADGTPGDVETHAKVVIADVKSDASLEDIQNHLKIPVPSKAAMEAARTQEKLDKLKELAADPKKYEVEINSQIRRIEEASPLIKMRAQRNLPSVQPESLESRLGATIKAMELHIEDLKRRPKVEVPNAGQQDTIQSVPRRDFGPPAQFNNGFGGSLLELQQRLDAVAPRRD